MNRRSPFRTVYSLVSDALFVAFLIASADLFAVDFRRAEPTLSDVHAASCRVRVSNARGTGIFNGYNAATGKAYVSTNDHVTSANRSCFLDFWTNSRLETVAGTVVYKSRNDATGRDFSIIEVDAAELKKIDPPYVPMKALDVEELVGRAFMSSGCPDGRFDQGWRGTIERVEGGMAIFSPPPVPGQSGSGICVIENGRVYDVAKLTYLLGTKGLDESKGGALPLANLVSALGNARADVTSRYAVVPVADEFPRLIAFTSENCPACVLAEPGLKVAEQSDGLKIERVDPLTDEGAAVARKYKVKEAPTYIAVDGNDRELARATWADIKRTGSRAAASDVLARASVRIQPEPVPDAKLEQELELDLPPLENAPSASETTTDDDGKKYKLGADNGVVVSSSGGTEKTIAVYITDPASYDFDAERVAASEAPAGLLNDLLRDDGAGNDNAPAPTPIAPRRRNDEDRADDSRGVIGGRALDAFADRLAERIDATVDGAMTRAQDVLNDARQEIEESVVKTVGEKIADAWKQYRARVAVLMFLVVFLASVVARATFGVVAAGVKKTRDAWGVLKAANAAARAVIKGDKE